ncbi:hypothetical protein [Paramicrobacterium agarici]|uniref:hypothetical protein n=1 Tax=Paramicrobacterium agarici TaxID=630514 RepID=UPI00115341B6|nr:hypothetical protein [Microbacterium agarici]
MTGGTATSAHRVIVPALASATGETAGEAVARVSGALRSVMVTGVRLATESGALRSVTADVVLLVMGSGALRSVMVTGVLLVMGSGALRSVMVTGVRLAMESVALADTMDRRAAVPPHGILVTGTRGCGRVTASLPAAIAMRALTKRS